MEECRNREVGNGGKEEVERERIKIEEGSEEDKENVKLRGKK